MLPGALAAFPLARRQRIARMIRRHKWMHARGFAGAIDATSGRYVPDSSEILISSPRPGAFYIPRSGIYPIKVAEVAYGAANKKAGLLAMNASTWNDHVRRGTKGWEAYKVSGLQFDPKYGSHPCSTYNTGKLYPVIWIPPLTGEEPEVWFSKPSPVPPVGPVVPPYVPPTPPPYVPPYVPPVPPYVPPTPPPSVPPYVPITPPDVPPVPPDVPPVPPYVPPTPPPVPPYVPPIAPPSGPGSGQLGTVLAGVTILGAVARLFER